MKNLMKIDKKIQKIGWKLFKLIKRDKSETDLEQIKRIPVISQRRKKEDRAIKFIYKDIIESY